MQFPTILGIIVVFIIWFAYQRRKGLDTKSNGENRFWEKETEANSIRRKSLDDLQMFTVNPDLIFDLNNNDFVLNDCKDKIKRLSERKIADFTGMTNTELKLKYGSPNLPLLTEYEENYIQLLRALNLYGKRLSELEYIDEALKVLEFAVSINSDISETYKTLKNIYIKKGSPEKIDFLTEAANKLNSINKKVILEILNPAK